MSAKFNGNGYLEPGVHVLDAAEIETQFVTDFVSSTTRKSIHAGYLKHSAAITGLVGDCEQYLDGSFVTNKNDPGDIDLVMLVDATVVDALSPNEKLRLKELVSGPITKAKYLCDAYFCPVYPAGHPMSDAARQQRKYWLGEFGYDRNDNPKGIVHAHLKKPASNASNSTP